MSNKKNGWNFRPISSRIIQRCILYVVSRQYSVYDILNVGSNLAKMAGGHRMYRESDR